VDLSLATTESPIEATSSKPAEPEGCLGTAERSDVSNSNYPVFVELAHREFFSPGDFPILCDLKSLRPYSDKLRFALKIYEFSTANAEADFQMAVVKSFAPVIELVPRLAKFYDSHLGVVEAKNHELNV
jgi:hypothetical protein